MKAIISSLSASLTTLAMPTKKKRTAQDARSRHKNKSPGFVTPMAALAVDALPEGPEWSYELKLDGYRALMIKDGAAIRLRSRNDKDLLPMYPAVVTLTPAASRASGGRWRDRRRRRARKQVPVSVSRIDHLPGGQ